METSIIAAIMGGLLVLGAVFCYLMAKFEHIEVR